MPEQVKDSRFVVQRSKHHEGFVVMDRGNQRPVTDGEQQDVLPLAVALNLSTDPNADKLDVWLAINRVEEDEQITLLQYLTYLVREKGDEENVRPTVDEVYLTKVAGEEDAWLIGAALNTALDPSLVLSGDGPTEDIRYEYPRPIIEAVPVDHRWRVAFILAQVLRDVKM